MSYYVKHDGNDRMGCYYKIVDSTTGEVVSSTPSKGGATNTCRAMNKRERMKRAKEAATVVRVPLVARLMA